MSLKSDPIFFEISKKLDILIRLFGLNLVMNIKVQKEQIALLSDAGFQPKEIADILGTTNNVVSVTLHSIRKERLSKKTKENIAIEKVGKVVDKGVEKLNEK